MIIKRRTRKDIYIDNMDQLMSYIRNVCAKKLKRCTEQNELLLQTIMNQTYQQNEQFKREMIKLWRPAYKNLSLFGWNPEEIEAEFNTRKEIKKKALNTALTNSGLQEKDYRRSLSNVCPEFWIKKGYTLEEAIIKVKETQSNNSKKVSNQSRRESSPRTLEYWIKRGFDNPEERRQMWQRESSQRCPEYWLNRGCSLEEAVKLVSETQRKSARYYYDNTPDSKIRENNVRCPEYYRARGFTEEEIKQQLKDNGRTFSLEICQQKYGEEEGFEIWKERQRKWQETLSNKSPEESRIIREKQGIMSTRNWGELNIPGIFYIIQISTENIKIGITTRDIDKRYNPKTLKDKRLHVHKVEDIHIAYKIEQVIKRNHIKEIQKKDHGVFGWTEVLSSSFDSILDEMNQLINNQDNLNLLFERTK